VRYEGLPIDRPRGRIVASPSTWATTVVFRVVDLVTGHTATGGAFENPSASAAAT
jgi:hypothetical protein